MAYCVENWRPNDEYWELWFDATRSCYTARYSGHVRQIDGEILRLSEGTWRRMGEGFAFGTRDAALRFISQPIGSRSG